MSLFGNSGSVSFDDLLKSIFGSQGQTSTQPTDKGAQQDAILQQLMESLKQAPQTQQAGAQESPFGPEVPRMMGNRHRANMGNIMQFLGGR